MLFCLKDCIFQGCKVQYCPYFKMLLQARSDDDVLLIRARCKRWTCSYCAERNRRIWRARIINHINITGGAWSWWTITAHSQTRGAKASLANLRNAWDKLMKRIRRHIDTDNWHYCRVYEKHKDGSYHIHAISSWHWNDIKVRKSKDGDEVKYSQWLSEQVGDLGIGWYTHADDIDASHHGGYIASYVTKYITKIEPDFKQELGRVRHIQTSQKWTRPENETLLDWYVVKGMGIISFAYWQKTERRVIDLDTGQQVTGDDFLEHDVYPPEFDT